LETSVTNTVNRGPSFNTDRSSGRSGTSSRLDHVKTPTLHGDSSSGREGGSARGNSRGGGHGLESSREGDSHVPSDGPMAGTASNVHLDKKWSDWVVGDDTRVWSVPGLFPRACNSILHITDSDFRPTTSDLPFCCANPDFCHFCRAPVTISATFILRLSHLCCFAAVFFFLPFSLFLVDCLCLSVQTLPTVFQVQK
jgi:hypothetical protein